jgi:hypothetical protein
MNTVAEVAEVSPEDVACKVKDVVEFVVQPLKVATPATALTVLAEQVTVAPTPAMVTDAVDDAMVPPASKSFTTGWILQVKPADTVEGAA